MKRAVALSLYVAYKLETHYWLGISLKNWLWPAVVASPALALLGRLSWPAAALLSAAGALLLAGTEWAKREHYVILTACTQEETSEARVTLDSGQRLAPIRVDEQIRCWASGLFAVEAKERHVVNADAQISFVSTREHIVMAYIRRTRFLLLATSPRKDVGWWYVFMTPDRLQEVRLGTLFCGIQSRAAIHIRYRSQTEPDRTLEVYLAFESEETRRRVLDDLRRDAPARVFA